MKTNLVSLDEVQTADFRNPVEDLSGVDTTAYRNPYDALLATLDEQENPNAGIQRAYEIHRTTRNAQKKIELLRHDLPGIVTDPILSNLLDPKKPDYVDPRNSLVFWARPPQHVLELAVHVQEKLKKVMPSIWLMPPEDMHTTVLEVVHSVPMDDVMEIANKLAPIMPDLTQLPSTTHGCTLFKPILSFDAAAVALSFVPYDGLSASGSETRSSPESATEVPLPSDSLRSSVETTPGPSTPATIELPASEDEGRKDAALSSFNTTLLPSNNQAPSNDNQTTYHHLRRKLYQRIIDAGVDIKSRYVVPSAHITLCRFLNSAARGAHPLSAELGKANILKFVLLIEELNEAFELAFTSNPKWEIKDELVCRVGTLWYGGGFTLTNPGKRRKWVKGEDGEWVVGEDDEGCKFHRCYSSDCSRVEDEMEAEAV